MPKYLRLDTFWHIWRVPLEDVAKSYANNYEQPGTPEWCDYFDEAMENPEEAIDWLESNTNPDDFKRLKVIKRNPPKPGGVDATWPDEDEERNTIDADLYTWWLEEKY